MQDQTAVRPRPESRSVAAAFGVVLGALALYLAIPRLYGETAVLVGRIAVIRAQQSAAADTGAARELALMLERAADAGGSFQAYGLAGQAHLVAGAPDRAAAAFRAALARNPAAPYDWARLTSAEYALGRPAVAAQAWRMSTVTGFFEPDLLERRLIQGWGLRSWLDAPGQVALDEQMTLFWLWDPGRLALFARRYGAEIRVRRLLADDPVALADFELRFSRVTPP